MVIKLLKLECPAVHSAFDLHKLDENSDLLRSSILTIVSHYEKEYSFQVVRDVHHICFDGKSVGHTEDDNDEGRSGSWKRILVECMEDDKCDENTISAVLEAANRTEDHSLNIPKAVFDCFGRDNERGEIADTLKRYVLLGRGSDCVNVVNGMKTVVEDENSNGKVLDLNIKSSMSCFASVDEFCVPVVTSSERKDLINDFMGDVLEEGFLSLNEAEDIKKRWKRFDPQVLGTFDAFRKNSNLAELLDTLRRILRIGTSNDIF